MFEATIKILGGLEVTVDCEIGFDEEEGRRYRCIEDFYITHIAGRKLRKTEKPNWLYKRIDATKGELDRIYENLNEALADENESAREAWLNL